ncbi:MAG: Ig-like domain-containing protein [Thermodesulfobacteriota bacterium]
MTKRSGTAGSQARIPSGWLGEGGTAALVFLTTLLVGHSGTALASFEKYSLVCAVYNNTDALVPESRELGIHLGRDAGLDPSQQTAADLDFSRSVRLAPAGAVSLARFPAGSSWPLLQAGCWASSGSILQVIVGVSTPPPAPPVPANTSPVNAFQGQNAVVLGRYLELAAGTAEAVLPANDPKSYDSSMNLRSANPGSYAGIIAGSAIYNFPELNLVPLATRGQALMYLYRYSFNTQTLAYELNRGPDPATEHLAILGFHHDGSIILNPTVSPPAIAPVGDRTAVPGVALSFTVGATDSHHDPLSFSLVAGPAGATLTDNGNETATFTWTPSPGDLGGRYDIIIQARNRARPLVYNTPGDPDSGVADPGGPALWDRVAVTINVAAAGDLNADGRIELQDVLQGLRLLAGIRPAMAFSSRVDLAQVLSSLEKVAGFR